ncbi:MAG: CRISPR-associated protein Cas4 [Paludibacteraceae bacterium]|nr:CRISPR-associated protein Cas4 [Paludibacteraceae bacterium]
MQITGTHFNYYQICLRKLWLFANGINMEHNSDLVFDGKLIHEESYPQRSERYEELELDGIKIDYYDAKNKIVHEIKRSNKVEQAHVWQVKYYLYVLEQNGIENATGILEYPTLRKTQEVTLSDVDRETIVEMTEKITGIIHSDTCPEKQQRKLCESCSYYEFCNIDEIEEGGHS